MKMMLVLWALPRSHSTPFEWMMRERGDFVTHHEPFGLTYHYGEDRRSKRHAERPVEADLTFATTWAHLQAEAERTPVFIKDFAHTVLDVAADAFLRRLTHSFLIRDPKLVLPSLHAERPNFTVHEAGYRAQRELFDRLCERDGSPPPVIDAESLVRAPIPVVRAYCEALGLHFRPRMLKWGRDPGRQTSWSREGAWQRNLVAGTSAERSGRRYVPVDHDEHLKRTYAECLPHYLAMRPYELRYD